MSQITFFKIFPRLETERLYLREITEDDVEPLFDIFSDPKVAEYDNHYPIESKIMITNIIKRWRQGYLVQEQIRWGIICKKSNSLIGTCFLGEFRFPSKGCEIGYQLVQREWNKGYITEALQRVISFGFEKLKLNRIEAVITPGNDASIQVLKRIGFTEEGLLRERNFFKGKFQDGIMMAMLKRDYDKSQA